MADNNDNFDNDLEPGNNKYQSPEDQFAKEPAAPAVAATPAKTAAFFGIFGIGAMILIYFIFFSGTKEEVKKDKITPPEPFIAQPADPVLVIPPPIVPDPPKLEEPITTEETENADIEAESQGSEERKKRIQSELLVTQGVFGSTSLGGGSNANPQDPNAVYGAANDNDPSIGFADSFYNQKNVPNAYARKLGDTHKLITQGKVIEAVLETPINTDVPGMIRAVVSRDVYAESGRAILIPKGSRMVGTYNNFIVRGNKRVNIIWSRVIRPDGIDVMIRSGAADQLGRAGIEGVVDNKYLEIFSSAFLVSAINIAVGMGVDAVQDDQIQKTTSPDGTQTQTSTAGQEATLRAVDLFGDAAENLIQNYINTKPTITIDQGTRISVFVNRDLIFPSSLTNDVTIIQ